MCAPCRSGPLDANASVMSNSGGGPAGRPLAALIRAAEATGTNATALGAAGAPATSATNSVNRGAPPSAAGAAVRAAPASRGGGSSVLPRVADDRSPVRSLSRSSSGQGKRGVCYSLQKSS